MIKLKDGRVIIIRRNANVADIREQVILQDIFLYPVSSDFVVSGNYIVSLFP